MTALALQSQPTMHSVGASPEALVESYVASLEALLPSKWSGVRSDLTLHKAPSDEWKQQQWTLSDPVAVKHFSLGVTEYKWLLGLRAHANLFDMLMAYQRRHGALPEQHELLAFLMFMQQEGLAIVASDTYVNKTPTNAWAKVRQVLFMRVPLWQPDAWLSKVAPQLSWLQSVQMRWLVIAAAVYGLLGVAPQLDQFLGAFNYLNTPTGAVLFAVCLAVLKLGHELAHAIVAKWQGINVPAMGVVLVLLWPLLYTDVSGAWKLNNRHARMKIAYAGIKFELSVAAFMLCLWLWLPDGELRSMCAFLCGASIITSILINLNPFMRFDGYYILMDKWGVDNLQPRAFAQFKYKIRRILWNWQGPVPEAHPQRGRLIAYGIGCALYRLFLGFSIAFGAYYLLFPAAGVVVFGLVIATLVLQPILSEFVQLWQQRKWFGHKLHVLCGAMVSAGLLSLAFVPTTSSHTLPASIAMHDLVEIKIPNQAQLAAPLPVEGTVVQQGEVLVRLDNTDLSFNLQQAQYDLSVVKQKIKHQGTSGSAGGYRGWLQAEQRRLSAVVDKYTTAVEQLVIVAPRSGVVVNRMPDVQVGDAIAASAVLLTLAEQNKYNVVAYIPEQDLPAIDFAKNAMKVRFNDFHTAEITGTQLSERSLPVSSFVNDGLYDIAGGPIASKPSDNGPEPIDNWYSMTFSLAQAPQYLRHGLPCRVVLFGESESLFDSLVSSATKALAMQGLI